MEDLKSFYKGKAVLVTGGLGAIGSNLVAELVSLGARVTILDCELPGSGANRFNIAEIADDIRLVSGDLRDAELLATLLPSQAVIFNLAAHSNHIESMKQPHFDTDINVIGTLTFLEAVKAHAPEARVVVSSTRGVYGKPGDLKVSEISATEPLDVYCVNRLASEHYHRVYARFHNLSIVAVRVSNCYGPRFQMSSPSYGILNWFIRMAIEDKDLTLYGDGSMKRDYNFSGDVIDLFLLMGANRSHAGEVYNSGSGRALTLMEICQKIVEIAGSGRVTTVPWPDERKAIDVGDFLADISKVKQDFNWQPTTSLEEGLKHTIAFYKEHHSHYWS